VIDYDVLVVGGAGVDTIVRVDSLPLPVADSLFVPPIRDYVGHTGTGVALGLHNLGVRVKFADFLGDDEQGRLILATLAAVPLDFSWTPAPAGTPRAVNLVDGDGRRLSLYDGRHPADLRLPREFWLPLVERSRHVHMSITNVNRDLFDDLERLGRSVSTDLHDWDGVNPHHQAYADRADLVFLSAAKVASVYDVLHGIAGRGRASVVVATDGANGCYVLERGTPVCHFPAVEPPAPVVDSNGAGDAFVSAFLYRWLAGRSVPDCVAAGLVAGAYACTAAGTHTALITAELLGPEQGYGPEIGARKGP
jgi:sugar/nucleoside kinase (ribokinase family)